ncbi:hypothetical protein ABZX95_44645 [Streptomyces sp. NPDC004232]|uniref:hypothetical protein n=1 Tax=unclassified Streptomyces TaxID=2593676 RepID=UPI0033ACAE20
MTQPMVGPLRQFALAHSNHPHREIHGIWFEAPPLPVAGVPGDAGPSARDDVIRPLPGREQPRFSGHEAVSEPAHRARLIHLMRLSLAPHPDRRSFGHRSPWRP